LFQKRGVGIAISLKESASSGRKPPRFARRMKLSRRLRPLSLENPHQAGEPYIIRPIIVADVTWLPQMQSFHSVSLSVSFFLCFSPSISTHTIIELYIWVMQHCTQCSHTVT